MTRRGWLAASLAAVDVLFAGATDIMNTSTPEPRDIAFRADHDGTEQKYVLLPPPTATADDARRDVLIALHGHGSDRWQFIRQPRDECRAVRDFAARHGLWLVSPDYRATTSWMGPAAEADLVQIIAGLKRDHRADRIFLCGGSMGGTACLTFAALHPEMIDGVASMNGTANLVDYQNFQEAIQASFGGTRTEVPEEYRKRSAEFAVDRLTMPIGLAVSGKDTSVPPHSVLRLAQALQALGRPVLLIHREDLGHVTTYDDALAILDHMLAHARPPTTSP